MEKQVNSFISDCKIYHHITGMHKMHFKND